MNPGLPSRGAMRQLIIAVLALVALACGGTSVTELAGPDPVRCQTALAPDARTVPADGGSVNITVTAARECEWTASADVSWAKLSATGGQGSATVAVVIGASPQASVRTAAIIINDQRLELSQEARRCSYVLSSSRADIGVDGGNLTVGVTTLEGCAWRAVSRDEWVNVENTDRAGSGTVAVDVAGNQSASAREGAATIAGQSFTIQQRGRGAGPSEPPSQPHCIATAQPTVIDVTAAAASETIRLDIADACDWAAASSVSWITVGQPAAGVGSAQVKLAIAANTAAARTGMVTIAQQTLTVRQAAAPCTYSIDPASRTFTHAGGEELVQVATRSDCQWTAVSDAPWAVVATPRGTGTGGARYIIQGSTEARERTATITVGGSPHVVTQSAFVSTCTYTLDPDAQTVSAAGGDASFRVITQNGCEWFASPGASWITIVTGTGHGSQDVRFTTQANSASQPRSTTISLGGLTHRVTQAGAR